MKKESLLNPKHMKHSEICILKLININIPLVSDTGSGREIRCKWPLYWLATPDGTITGVDEMKWMRWVGRNGGMKLVVGKRGERNSEKNLLILHFVYHETYRTDRDANSGRQRLTACAMETDWNYYTMYVKLSAWRQVCPSICTIRVVHISVC